MAEIPYDIEAELAEDAESIKEKQDHRDIQQIAWDFVYSSGFLKGGK